MVASMMNAYELADKQAFETGELSMWTRNETANMLRQQADRIKKYELRNQEQIKRIAELEKQLQESAMNCISAYAQADDHYARLKQLEKQSEPVAWMKNQYSPDIGEYIDYRENALPDYIPLYTTPHHASDVKQTKPLSDEEILQQAEWIFGINHFESIDDPYWIGFARAIEAKVRGQ